MSDEEDRSEYPDPQASYLASYSSASYPRNHASQSGPYGDPARGGLWQSSPAVIEDHYGKSKHGSPDQDPDTADLRELYADFSMHQTISAGGAAGAGGAGAEDDMSDDEMDPTFDEALDAQSAFFDRASRRRGDVTSDDDSNFHESDEQDGASSDGSLSLDEDLLDEVLNEATAATRGSTRGRTRGRGRGRPRGWKWALKGTEHDPNFGKRGRPRGRPRLAPGEKRGRKSGPQRAVDPGEDFKRQQALATEQFVAGNLDAAAELARAAVRVNPEVFAAHSLLSEVLEAQGKRSESLAVIFAGAHTRRDPELWKTVAGRAQDLAGDNVTISALDTAAYCYQWAIKLNPADYDARRARLNCLLESFTLDANPTIAVRARQDCRAMLKLQPGDILVARELAELAALTRGDEEIRTAKTAYDEAMNAQPHDAPFGPSADEDEQWNHVLAYVALVERIDGDEDAIKQFKRLVRAVQKRRDETHWDDYPDDDREFDIEDDYRKNAVPEYKPAKHGSDAHMIPMDLRIKLGFYRLALGDAHFEEAIHHFKSLLSEDGDVESMSDLFRDVANGLKTKSKMAQAIWFYEPLQNVPEALDMEYYMELATCYIHMDQKSEAEDCYRIVIEQNPGGWEARVALARIYEEQGRRAEALPLINEVIRLGRNDALRKHKLKGNSRQIQREERRKNANISAGEEGAALEKEALDISARSLFDQVIMDLGTDEQRELRKSLKSLPRRRTTASGQQKRSTGSNVTLEKQRKLAEQIKDLKSTGDRVRSNHEIVKSCEADVEAGDEEAIAIWKYAVEGMVQEYKLCKYLYSGRDKYLKFQGYGRPSKVLFEMEQMRTRLEDERVQAPSVSTQDGGVPDDFCDIKFDVWLDLFCNLALQQAREGEQEECYGTVESALASNVFYHSQQATTQLYTTLLAAALVLHDEERLTTASRWFMSAHPASETPYQIFAAVHRLYSGPPNWFNAGPTQKYLLRAIKSFDWHVLPDSVRADWPFTDGERKSLPQAKTRNEGWAAVEELPVSFLATYGHVMSAAQTWTSALNYYYRALALRPGDPMLLLCIGLAYVQGAMKRQAENRHWSILTGLGFLTEYKQARVKLGEKLYVQEAEYNVARTWHFLGLTHLALHGYRKCLRLGDEMAEERAGKMDVDGDEQEGHEEYTQEAALGLINIYNLTGQMRRARAVAERYLVI